MAIEKLIAEEFAKIKRKLNIINIIKGKYKGKYNAKLIAEEFNNIIEGKYEIPEGKYDIREGESLNRKIGDWYISKSNDLSAIHLTYKNNPLYSIIQQTDFHESIQFRIFHKNYRENTETTLLDQLDTSFKILAKKRNQKITVIFDPLGQNKDTQDWLMKKGYVQNNQNSGNYQKMFLNS